MNVDIYDVYTDNKREWNLEQFAAILSLFHSNLHKLWKDSFKDKTLTKW